MRKILLLLAMASLCSCGSIPDIYVAADRATFDAVAPDYVAYVNGDESLNDDQRRRRLRTIESWDMRITAAEETDEPR